MAATRDESNLLAHEAAFALGQMQEFEAIPALTSVLNDLSLHPIVRHEVPFSVFFIFYFGSLNFLLLLPCSCFLFLLRRLALL